MYGKLLSTVSAIKRVVFSSFPLFYSFFFLFHPKFPNPKYVTYCLATGKPRVQYGTINHKESSGRIGIFNFFAEKKRMINFISGDH